jgi:hypothetical protein
VTSWLQLLITSDTILRWHRDIVALVLRLARGGYRRYAGGHDGAAWPVLLARPRVWGVCLPGCPGGTC